MWRRRICVGVVAALMGAAIWAATAAVGEVSEGRGTVAQAGQGARAAYAPFARVRAHSSELGLTEAQRAELRDIAAGHRSELWALSRRIRSLRVELQDTIASGEADEAAIRAKVAVLTQVMADRAVLAARIAAQSRLVFTQEQLEKLKQMRGDRRHAADRWLEQTAPRRETKDTG